MPPRASWKGYLKIGEVRCQVALFAAVSTAERVNLHTVNRATGHRVQRRYVDSVTGKPVEREDQVKGYDIGNETYLAFEPEEIAAAIPDSNKTMNVDTFITCDDIETVYLERPYFLAPANKMAADSYALLRAGMAQAKVAALAQTVIFRRLRTFLIRAHDTGLIATTLNYDYEVRSAREAFRGLPKTQIKGEMLDLAKHIIRTKRGTFDPASVDDRYEEALKALIKAKLDGKPVRKPAPRQPAKVIDLMDALRRSASRKSTAPAPRRAKTARKARLASRKRAS